jgi:hypothetical protein
MRQINIYYTGESWGAEAVRGDGALVMLEVTERLQTIIDELAGIVDGYKTEAEQLAETAFELAEAHATDEEMLTVAALAPEWMPDVSAVVGQMRRYQGIFYRCIQAHTTQSSWTPDVTPALWVALNEDEAAGEEIINWFEPTSTHYYTFGQLVRYTDGKVYESLLEVNVWSPEAYPAGWQLREDLE